MATTDALPVPRKNVAFRVTFPIYKNDGTLITGASSLDSEVSKDGGTFADCTNEATEIATNSGIYYLDLTSTEMNADCVAVIVKTSSTGACIPSYVFYPQEAGDIQTNVTYWSGTAVASPDTAGYVKATLKSGTGTGEVSLTSGIASVNASQIAGNATAATNLSAAARSMVPGTVATAGFSPTVTEFESGDITEATADHYNGRLIEFYTGALAGQQTLISDYALSSGRGHFTVVAMTEAPANGDAFAIV